MPVQSSGEISINNILGDTWEHIDNSQPPPPVRNENLNSATLELITVVPQTTTLAELDTVMVTASLNEAFSQGITVSMACLPLSQENEPPENQTPLELPPIEILSGRRDGNIMLAGTGILESVVIYGALQSGDPDPALIKSAILNITP